MEGPVKERLTGALILVAAVFIIVPEILSGPGPRVASSAPAPAQPADAGAPLRTYSMVLNGSADSQAAGQATLAPQPAVAAPPVVAPQPVAAAAEPAPTAAASTQATIAPSPVAPDPPVAARQPTIVAAAAGTGRWWTQLGSFSARDNADRLVHELRAAGYSIDMSKVSAEGKELYRVRAGPVSSRAEALALQSRLESAGHKSSIVAP